MNDPLLMESLALENGLTLDLLDASRTLAGDRWLIHLVARIRIPLTPDLLEGVPDGPRLLDRLRQEFGEALEYRADLKRHFVGDKERDTMLRSFVDIVRREKLPYLSHPDFARRFAVRCGNEIKWGPW